MLSGESAGGKFPAETVAMMAQICVEAEQFVYHSGLRLNSPAGDCSHDPVTNDSFAILFAKRIFIYLLDQCRPQVAMN